MDRVTFSASTTDSQIPRRDFSHSSWKIGLSLTRCLSHQNRPSFSPIPSEIRMIVGFSFHDLTNVTLSSDLMPNRTVLVRVLYKHLFTPSDSRVSGRCYLPGTTCPHASDKTKTGITSVNQKRWAQIGWQLAS